MSDNKTELPGAPATLVSASFSFFLSFFFKICLAENDEQLL
jgi:hypothetical protein